MGSLLVLVWFIVKSGIPTENRKGNVSSIAVSRTLFLALHQNCNTEDQPKFPNRQTCIVKQVHLVAIILFVVCTLLWAAEE